MDHGISLNDVFNKLEELLRENKIEIAMDFIRQIRAKVEGEKNLILVKPEGTCVEWPSVCGPSCRPAEIPERQAGKV
jgi:hypothetical protein